MEGLGALSQGGFGMAAGDRGGHGMAGGGLREALTLSGVRGGGAVAGSVLELVVDVTLVDKVF